MTEKTREQLDGEIAALIAQRDAQAATEATAAHFSDTNGAPLAIEDDFAHGQAVLRSAGIAMEESIKRNPIHAESFMAPEFDGTERAKELIDEGDYVAAMIQLAMANAKKALG